MQFKVGDKVKVKDRISSTGHQLFGQIGKIIYIDPNLELFDEKWCNLDIEYHSNGIKKEHCGGIYLKELEFINNIYHHIDIINKAIKEVK